MPNYQVITHSTHQDSYWKRPEGYQFAAKDGFIMLTVQEVSRAALSLPMGFIAAADEFILVAVLGLKPDQNLLVNDAGQWLVPYIPAAYRGYPFALTKMQDSQRVLCIDQDSGLINGTEGEHFFEMDEPSEAVRDILNFLQKVSENQEITNRLCQELKRFNLITPWSIQVQSDSGLQQIDGLYKVDEKSLNALSAEDFERLRQTGVLPLVYCQLLSMQHIQMLLKIEQAQARHTQASQELDLDQVFGEADEDVFKF